MNCTFICRIPGVIPRVPMTVKNGTIHFTIRGMIRSQIVVSQCFWWLFDSLLWDSGDGDGSNCDNNLATISVGGCRISMMVGTMYVCNRYVSTTETSTILERRFILLSVVENFCVPFEYFDFSCCGGVCCS